MIGAGPSGQVARVAQVAQLAARESVARPEDTAEAARTLVDSLVANPWGQVSPSVYETGRLVALAPWLVGHDRRIEFLLASQRPDGTWGGPDGYALVPTLSATEALLTALCRANTEEVLGPSGRIGYGKLVDAASRGLRWLFAWLGGYRHLPVPDTPAIEIIVPALVASINAHLARISGNAIPGLDKYLGSRLLLPSGMDMGLLSGFRSALESGASVPEKLLHSLEVAGSAAYGRRTVHLEPPGTVGASPAATAAWLGDRKPADFDHPAVRYLEAVVNQHDGPVPCGTPITVFERAWVLSTLTGTGIEFETPMEIVNDLVMALGPTGTPAGAGLPPDADTTAVALLTLARLGSRCDVECLWSYDNGSHFCTWQGERGYSTSVNAHVMEALGTLALSRPEATSRCDAALNRISSWLQDQQGGDGSWLDRWHASAYYATACCTLALDRFGRGDAPAAVRRAVNWVLATQRAGGPWGRWSPTVEETAYAIQILLSTRFVSDRTVLRAAARGYSWLRSVADESDHPPLWHDKDLYLPVAIVRAARLGALHLAQRNPEVAALAADEP